MGTKGYVSAVQVEVEQDLLEELQLRRETSRWFHCRADCGWKLWSVCTAHFRL